jgi:hypothetical protein
MEKIHLNKTKIKIILPILLKKMATRGSVVVEHSPSDPKIKGLNPATTRHQRLYF